jgi:diacylglycerol kinase family enzyme
VKEGAGLAILVNANAKRGGRRVAAEIRRALPGASVRLTRTIDEIEGWLRGLSDPKCVLAAGGDGSAVALLNALDRVVPKSDPFPPVGSLPLGTGNAWAHSLGARKLGVCVKSLAAHDGPIPTKRYTIFDCEGTLAFFAGCGWDAQILNDFKEQVEASPSRRLAKSVGGYVSAMLLRTVPKAIVHGRPQLTIENLADTAYTITADDKVLKLYGARRGTVLYDGWASVSGAATCPEYGYRFRAFPFAERMLGMMNVRVYDQKPVGALLAIPDLWKGAHPLAGMHDWFSTHVRFTYSRPMPLQIGGEAIGIRRTVEYKVSDRRIDALDWRRLA